MDLHRPERFMAPFNPLLTSVELGLFYSKERNLAVTQKIARAQSLPRRLQILAFLFSLSSLPADLIVGIWWCFLTFLPPFIVNSQTSD